MRHSLGEMNRSGRGWKCRDPSRTERCGSFGRTTDLQDRDVFIRFELQLLQKHASRYIGRASDSTDPNALTLELLCRANRFVHDQFIGQCVDEHPMATTLAPPTAAFAVAPPEMLPTATEPATTAEMVVVEEGI